MEKTVIILYASEYHLNTVLSLAKFINKHHPSTSITIIGTASSASISTTPLVTYHQLPTGAILSQNLPTDAVELPFEIARLNNPNLQKALSKISRKSRIKAFVMDYFCNPAFEVSRSFGLPTYYYVSPGGPYLCAFLYFPTIDEVTGQSDVGSLKDFFEIPGCPLLHSTDFPKAMSFRESNSYKVLLEASQTIRKSDGILTNGFDALEIRAKEALSNGICVLNSPTPPVFFVGPLGSEINTRDNVDSNNECLKWLSMHPCKSVILLSFGRRGLFSARQLKEMAIGLERSGHRFLWAIRNPPENANLDMDELLPEGFLQRVRGRGLIVKSWIPQKEILSHESIGGFVTHCGRSSVLESVRYGVPMIGWPIDAEQRLNRVVLVEETKVALPLDEAEDGFVTALELEKRVKELMESVEGRAIRQRIGELKVAGEVAMKKGGSSLIALEKFMEHLIVGAK